MEGLNADAAQLEIETRPEDGGTCVISVAGDLDISNAARLQAAVASAAAQSPSRLVLDLSGLRFMDSAGIAVLLGAVSTFGDVQLRDPSPAVRRVLEITGLTQVVPIQP